MTTLTWIAPPVEVLSCPSWCTTSHSGDEDDFMVEHVFAPDTLADVDADVRAVRVDIYEAEGTLSDSHVWLNDRNVTPAEARRIAAALLAAADTAEAESRRAPATNATPVGDLSHDVVSPVDSARWADTGADIRGGAK